MARRHKELNAAARAARRAGWSITNRHGHEYWRSPDGKRVTVSSSPSDGNAYKNALRDLRKAGLAV
jgi:predicted RNA binding protein YcfA (HicA-like mRNA interferase family)